MAYDPGWIRRRNSGNFASAAWGVTGPLLAFDAATITDTSSAGVVATAAAYSIGVPTLAASAATTYTAAATLYVGGDPVAGTNVTITAGYGIWNVGKTRMDDTLVFSATGKGASFNGGGTITGASGAVTVTPLSGQNFVVTTAGGGTFNANAYGNIEFVNGRSIHWAAGGTITETSGTGNLEFHTTNSLRLTLAATTGVLVFNPNSVASNPAHFLTGTWFTGGSGTTTLPHFYIQPTGATASTTLSTSGTAFGINATTGFAGNFLDLMVAGASAFKVTSGGNTTANNLTTVGGGVTLPGAYGLEWSGQGLFNSPSNGVFKLADSAGTSFGRLQFGGTTSSFPAIKRNGAALNFRLADDSADAAITALSISTSTAAVFHVTTVALTDGAGVSTGTLTNAPAATNPTKWIGINDNGTTRYIPAW